MQYYCFSMLYLCIILFLLGSMPFHKCTVLVFCNPRHKISSNHLFFYPLHVNSHSVLLPLSTINAIRGFCILKAAVLESLLGAGQGELVLEAFLNCSLYLELSCLWVSEAEQPSLCVEARLRWKCSTVWDSFYTASFSLDFNVNLYVC